MKALGFAEKAKSGKLEAGDMEKVVAKYNEDYKSDFYADMHEDQEQARKAAALDALAGMLAEMGSEETTTTAEETKDGQEKPKGEEKPIDVSAQVKLLIEKNAQLEKTNKENSEKIEKLSKTLENDTPKTEKMKVEGFALVHTDKYAFGIEHSMFDMKKRWNKITVNPRVATLDQPTEEDEKAFKAEVNALGVRLGQRVAYLFENNLLDPKKLMAASTLDISEVGTELGNYYVIRRTDALIARLLQIPTIYDFFPRRYGIQDMEVINNVLVGEVSQAWQKGKVFKGSVEIKPEFGHVDDVSIKLQIEPLVEIERNYIGYKLTEGSDPVKWGMIEYYALVILEKAIIEQIKRRVMGCYVKPETNTPGPFMTGSTGIIFQLLRYAHQYKLQLNDDAAYATYDDTDMLETVDAFVSEVVDSLVDEEIENFTLVLNRKHKPWYIKNVRTTYGKDTDFAGVRSNVLPNFEIPIYWIPAMGDHKFMILTKPGNIQCLENQPGEMQALKFEGDFEDVLVRSRWKEGTAAAFVGKKFATKALLVANKFEYQQIFMNKPATVLADNATTANAATNFWFVTAANTGVGDPKASPAITDITGAKKGQVYIIESGEVGTYPSTIAQALKFSELTAAWTPEAEGDYIMVVLNDAGTKFRELERCVDGVRSVNAAVQPTLPEAR